MTARALRFGSVAAAYERFRPGYPVEIVDRVMVYAGRPVRTALEVGAGTGKATRLFTQRGVAVVATDPDPAMLDELRKHVPEARTAPAGFEDLSTDERFDLVYAAAAMHWTRPDGRWSRVAALLEPGGVFANFGGPVRFADPALEQAVQEARSPFLATDEVPSPDETPPDQHLQWPGTELETSEWFTDVEQVEIPRHLAVDAGDYVGYLSTVSAYLELPTAVQQLALERIAAVLPETVEIDADITLHLARRGHPPRL